jgi:TrmH family RNA methyltransferase
VEPVRSSRNSRVAEAIRLHRARRRAETRRTLLEGPHLLEEAIGAAVPLQTVFVCDGDEATFPLLAGLDLDSILVTEDVMMKVAGTQHPRGPVAIMAIPPDRPTLDRSVMVSWGVGDPGNVGTLIRSAAAFGLGFLAGPGTADPWSPKVLRAGAGAHFRTAIERPVDVSVDALRERGFTVAASVVEGGDSPGRLAGIERCALLVGDEGSGLAAGVVTQADLLITIPMTGHTESLNAAVAGSLLAYELTSRLPKTS